MAIDDKPLDADDFPVQSDAKKVVKKDGKTIATTPTPEVADDVADRLNENEYKRQEDEWNL